MEESYLLWVLKKTFQMGNKQPMHPALLRHSTALLMYVFDQKGWIWSKSFHVQSHYSKARCSSVVLISLRLTRPADTKSKVRGVWLYCFGSDVIICEGLYCLRRGVFPTHGIYLFFYLSSTIDHHPHCWHSQRALKDQTGIKIESEACPSE